MTGSALEPFVLMHRRIGSPSRPRAGKMARWKQAVSELYLLPGQFYQVMDVHTTQILDAGGWHESMGLADGEISPLSLAELVPTRSRLKLLALSQVIVEVGNELKTNGTSFSHYQYAMADTAGQLTTVRRRSIVTDVDELFRPHVYLSVYQRLNHVDHRDEVSAWVVGRGRRRTIERWLQRHQVGSVSLTRREQHVLDLVSQGASSREAGQLMGISRHTVDTLRRRLLAKTGARGTSELVARMHDTRGGATLRW